MSWKLVCNEKGTHTHIASTFYSCHSGTTPQWFFLTPATSLSSIYTHIYIHKYIYTCHANHSQSTPKIDLAPSPRSKMQSPVPTVWGSGSARGLWLLRCTFTPHDGVLLSLAPLPVLGRGLGIDTSRESDLEENEEVVVVS